MGEPQLVFNYVRALSDFSTSFAFSRGVSFATPDATSAIVPYLLQRIWEEDNRKENVMWEMGSTGSVTGDCFIKIAYEEPFTDPGGMNHPGKVRIIVLNPSFCFPEWMPHDRDQMERFKLKYRFWATGQNGMRQVMTYTELLTPTMIEEYVNDQLISSRPNPIGEIPVVHIRNLPVSGSPWGMADIQDVVPLNREYNEKATDISDIINYHAAPVTVVTGARGSQLEKGPKKVWSIPSEKARISNLEVDPTGVEMAINFLNLIKEAMHEMTGVPVGALGQAQPISNTSGVALAIQYMPLQMRFFLKKIQYGKGIEQINRLALRTLYLKEPQMLRWNPIVGATAPQDDALTVLDYNDPVAYKNTAVFQPPLPVDRLVALNELQLEMAMGLESKEGALKKLGEQFPGEKLEELFEELLADAERQAALDYLKSLFSSFTAAVTGMIPGAPGAPPTPVPPPPASANSSSAPETKPAGGAGVTSAMGGVPQAGPLAGMDITDPEDQRKMFSRVVTMAHGANIPRYKPPEESSD